MLVQPLSHALSSTFPSWVSSFIITASVIYIPTHISSLDLWELQTCTATGSVHVHLEVAGVSRLHISEITPTVLLALCPTPPLPLSTWSSSWALCLRAWESLPTQAQPEASSLTRLPVRLLCRICLATLVRGTIIAHKLHKTTSNWSFYALSFSASNPVMASLLLSGWNPILPVPLQPLQLHNRSPL